MRVLLALMALMALGFAACDGKVSYVVPAVVGNGGGLVNVTMEQIPGTGEIYTSVYPRTGITTQESIAEAVSYAARLSKKDGDCDIIVDFGDTASEIEGPSAGAAMTVMAFALFEGEAIRNDTIITGTVDPLGNVGPVGGLYEKAKGAASIDARYFITPVENLYEMLLLRDLEGQYGITILQARTVEDVIGFMIFNESIAQEGLSASPREAPVLDRYGDAVPGFEPVARKMIGLEEQLAESLDAGDDQASVIRRFFESETSRQESMLDDGYAFSAANEAFLDFIDLSTIKVILEGDADLPRKKGEAGICLSRIKRPNLTDANFEWVVGSDLRTAWAEERLRSTDVTEDLLTDEGYFIYNELMYAHAWCLVAEGLASSAPEGGNDIDESAWKALAERRISEARAAGPSDAESISKLNSAQDSYAKGRYGAAIFDSVYVIENAKSALNDSAILDESRTSLWGKIYQSHAAFLRQQNQSAVALRTARLAKGLDEAAFDMRRAMVITVASAPGEETAPAAEGREALYIAAAAIAFLLVIVVIILIRHGKRKGPLKAYGAREKKGGTRVQPERP